MTHTATALSRRRLLAALSLLATATPGAAVFAQAYREISWDDLVPKGWDPMKSMPDRGAVSPLNDADPRAQAFYNQLREAWDNAPTVKALDGRRVKLPGYIVPLELTKEGLHEFLLVPYFGACIHTPPPPANQIVLVRTAPVKGLRSMDAVWVTGTLDLQRAQSQMGVTGYGLQAASVTPFK